MSHSRVIGTLLGSVDGGVVTLTSGYKVPHKEVEDEVAINMEFNENLYRLQKRVAPNEVIVGWFTTSKGNTNTYYNMYLSLYSITYTHPFSY